MALAWVLTPAPAVRAAAGAKPTDRASLERCLDDDYARLLRGDPNAAAVRRAAALLASTNRNSRWTDFFAAVGLVRQHRSMASVPLLMKYMVAHATLGSSHIAVPLYADAITVLTGEAVDAAAPTGPDREASAVAAVLALYNDWWHPNQAKLTVDVGRMSDEQVGRVVDALLRHAAKEQTQHDSGSNHDTPSEAAFDGLLASANDSGTQLQWWPEELDPQMVPALLAAAGVATPPPADPTNGSADVNVSAVPLLAAACRRGGLAAIDRAAADVKQDDAARLACLLALNRAGYTVHDKSVLPIATGDQRLACRVMALLMVRLCPEARGDVPLVVARLDDDNREVRAAALSAVAAVDPKAAVPKVADVLRTGQPDDLIRPGLRLLGHVGGTRAAALLVGYMDRVVANGTGSRGELLDALIAYQSASGTHVIEAGAHPEDYYTGAARRAVADWKRRQR